MKKGKTSLNLITNLIAFVINMIISFKLTPYVSENLGNEAYGFITLANSVISYFTVVSMALNAYASRFICLHFFKGDYEESKKYYSSVLFSNIILVMALLIILGPFLYNITFFFKISPNLITDVRILFITVFMNYFITLLAVTYTVAPIINNRLDIDAIKNIINCVLKAVLICAGFIFLGKYVWIVGAATLVCSAVCFTINFVYHFVSVKQLRFGFKYISIKHTVTVLKSGIWASVGSLGNVLNSGLDMWVTNRYLDGNSMGYIAIGATLLNLLVGLTSTLNTIFWPKTLEAYSQNRKEDVLNYISKSSRLQVMLSSMVFAGFTTIGKDFLRLWVPQQDEDVLYVVVWLGVLTYTLASITKPIGLAFTLTNRLKLNAVFNILMGFMNITAMLLLLQFSSLGVYAVSLTSAVPGILYCMIFVPIASTLYLKCKVSRWYKESAKAVVICLAMTVIFGFLSKLYISDSWLLFFAKVALLGIVGLVINFFVLLTKDDRSEILNKVLHRKKA